MVASLVYRTADGTRWGGGQGSDLAAVTIDLNFWTLFSAVEALEDASVVSAGIDYINQPVGGNLFYVHLTNHAVLGPFVIPSTQWNPRGAWAVATAYSPYDLVTNNGSLYLVLIAHTSNGSTFSATATDGLGHNLYSLLVASPANALPSGAAAGSKLIKNSATDYDTRWAFDVARLVVYCAGQPLPGEILMKYQVVDNMMLPVGLYNPGSSFNNTLVSSDYAVYTISKFGTGSSSSFPIGTLTWNGGSSPSIAFAADVSFVPGDIIILTAPAVPDLTQSDISFTFVAKLTG